MDLALAASGSGYGHSECPQGIPIEFALLSILAAFGAAFGILYVALTQQTMGRRRRRSVEVGQAGHGNGELVHQHQHQHAGEEEVAVSLKLADIFMFGEKHISYKFNPALLLFVCILFSRKNRFRSIFLESFWTDHQLLCTPGVVSTDHW